MSQTYTLFYVEEESGHVIHEGAPLPSTKEVRDRADVLLQGGVARPGTVKCLITTIKTSTMDMG